MGFGRMTRDRYLDDAELGRFMAAVRERRHRNQPRDHAFFALLSATGIRPSEAMSLTLADLHLGARRPWITVRRLKKRRECVDSLAIPESLAVVLREYAGHLQGDSTLHLFDITKRQSRRLFHTYADLAGITRKVRLYILRHTAGTRLYHATHDIGLVQALLGHDSADTTAIYAHISPESMIESAGDFPAIV